MAGLLALAVAAGAEQVDLSQHERTIYSQFGEEGVVEKIFELIQPTHRYAVEFGASDGIEHNNMRCLVLKKGWGGL